MAKSSHMSWNTYNTMFTLDSSDRHPHLVQVVHKSENSNQAELTDHLPYRELHPGRKELTASEQ